MESRQHKITQTIQALTSHFLAHKIFSNSIIEQLCSHVRIHSSTEQDEIINNVMLVCQGFSSVQKSKRFIESNSLKRQYCNMLNVFLFNLSAINEHFLKQIENEIIQSTASQSNARSGPEKEELRKNVTNKNDKAAIQKVKSQIKLFFSRFLETNYIKTVIKTVQDNISSSKISLDNEKISLLETLDYLCVKYCIESTTSDMIVSILQNTFTESTDPNTISCSKSKQIGKALFSAKRQSQLYLNLETNPDVDFRNIINIVDCNYLHQNPQRKIFHDSELSGKQVIQKLLLSIFKKVGKNELFAESLEDYTPFRAFMYHLLDQFYGVYFQFNSIVKRLLNLSLNASNTPNFCYLSQAFPILLQIQKFLRVELTVYNQSFNSLIQFIYKSLEQRYSSGAAIDLIKKLLLNRFLLNPAFFILYDCENYGKPSLQSEERLKKYVEIANLIRIMFYSHKVDDFILKNPVQIDLKAASLQIQESLIYCAKSERVASPLFPKSCSLYVNDNIIIGRMGELFHQIKDFSQKVTPNSHSLNIQNIKSDQSLSFSFVKNGGQSSKLNQSGNQYSVGSGSKPYIQNVSEVKIQYTNRSNNVKDNQSIRVMYDQLQHLNSPSSPSTNMFQISPNKGQTRSLKPVQGHPPKSPHKIHIQGKNLNGNNCQNFKSNQTDQTAIRNDFFIPNERQIIEQLVDKRKEYGQKRRLIGLKSQQRRKNRQTKQANLTKYSNFFEDYKNQVASNNNFLYIEMSIS